jgi:hypothetical protein
MKNRATKSVAQISATPNKFCNLSTSKMGKTLSLYFTTVDTLKKLSCYSKDTKRKKKRN